MLPNIDEFAEGVVGQPLYSLVDIFLGYNNIITTPRFLGHNCNYNAIRPTLVVHATLRSN